MSAAKTRPKRGGKWVAEHPGARGGTNSCRERSRESVVQGTSLKDSSGPGLGPTPTAFNMASTGGRPELPYLKTAETDKCALLLGRPTSGAAGWRHQTH